MMMTVTATATAVMAFVTALTMTTTAMRVESAARTHAHHCKEIYLFRFTPPRSPIRSRAAGNGDDDDDRSTHSFKPSAAIMHSLNFLITF
uniref:Putative secreted protein n=1 Tax=Anopheles darlingi TaxID=43151 RepID=A0A2M4DJ03_ANODA